MEGRFQLVSPYEPQGDQPQAIAKLVDGLQRGVKHQTLLGATGTGKTFTISNVIAQVNKPTLVIAHNKTLAGQLYSELKEFFPHNAVEYFVSYYDYYQPEAYVPQTDTYIEKDAKINDEIDKLRHSATSALFERRDVIIVASVSCIYGLGSPEEYRELVVSLRVGMEIERNALLRRLVDIQYDRNDIDFRRGTFRVRGDVVEIFPASRDEHCIRVEFFGDEIERIREVDALTGEVLGEREHVAIFPASHFVTREEKMRLAIQNIEQELEERLAELRAQGKLLEAQRLEQRTRYDLEMMREMGFCSGIENYSRHLALRPPGRRRIHCLTIFRTIFDSSWMSRTSPCRSCAACTTATGRASKCSSTTASACRRRWTTGRSRLTSSSKKSIKLFTSRRRQGRTSLSTARASSNKSSARPGFSTQRSTSVRRKGKSTI
ncbi:UvrABC system protein B [Geobacillus sp. BCO2]|nr:UvrABC system protein B [Geobacillus sp. BCO2]